MNLPARVVSLIMAASVVSLLSAVGCRSSQKAPPPKPAPIVQATVQLSGDAHDAGPGEELDALAKLLLADPKVEEVVLHAATGTTAIYCVGRPGTDAQMLASLVRARLSDAALADNRFLDTSSAGPVQTVSTIPAPTSVTRPELVVSADADTAARYGLSVTELDRKVADALRVAIDRNGQFSQEDLDALTVELAEGTRVPLTQVADAQYEMREVQPVVLSYPR